MSVIPNNMELRTSAVKTIDFNEYKGHEGDSYLFTMQQDRDDTETIVLLITTPSTTNLWVHFLVNVRGDAEANVILYEDPTQSAQGTAQAAFNRNRNSANTPGTTVHLTPTTSDLGTNMWEKHFGSGVTVGGEERADVEFILANDEEYLLIVTSEASNNDISLEIGWQEHVNLKVGDTPDQS